MTRLTMFVVTAAWSLTLFTNGASAQDWGNVTGQVTYVGKAPVRNPVKVIADAKVCVNKDGTPLLEDVWLVNPRTLGVQNVYVWLEPVAGAKMAIHPKLQTVPQKPVVVDQPCCMFEPRCVALREGQDLLVKNSATIAHNVKITSIDERIKQINPVIPPGGSLTVKSPGDLVATKSLISINCTIHPWMGGNIRVFNHPYFALTDANGQFTLKDAPAGKYHLVVWHEGVGWGPGGKQGSPITIAAGKDNDPGKIELK